MLQKFVWTKLWLFGLIKISTFKNLSGFLLTFAARNVTLTKTNLIKHENKFKKTQSVHIVMSNADWLYDLASNTIWYLASIVPPLSETIIRIDSSVVWMHGSIWFDFELESKSCHALNFGRANGLGSWVLRWECKIDLIWNKLRQQI